MLTLVYNQPCLLTHQKSELVLSFFISIIFYANPRNMTADTLSLAGKTALVTGSSKENGIGSAIARGLARNGASVAIHYASDHSKARAEKVAMDINKEFGTKTTVVQGRSEDHTNANRMVEQILKAFNVDHIDILGT